MLGELPFREIVFVDTEFIAGGGRRPDPVAVCALEAISGRTHRIFGDEAPPVPPYPIGDDTLLVAFCAAAELETHLALGWALPKNVLDLRVEHIQQTVLSERKDDDRPRPKQPRALLDVLSHYRIHDGDAPAKASMRALIMRGWPFTADERELILRYCHSDVEFLPRLLAALLPGMHRLDQALHRGAYVAFTAEVAHNGIPFDRQIMQWLARPEVRQACRLRLVSDERLTHGLYDGATLKKARLDEFVIRHRLPWRRTPTGQLGHASRDFDRLAESRPEFADLAEIEKTLGQLHEFGLGVGDDGRCRTPLWAFSTITSRMAPNGSEYPFTTAGWTRPLITPQPGTALAYLDYASMEFGVAMGLSRDPNGIADYESGDPYLGLGVRAALLRAGIKDPAARSRLKPVVLGCQYGMGGPRAGRALGISRSRGQRFVELHHRRYRDYWEWSDWRLDHAFADGFLRARDGWQCRVNSRTSIVSARNWLIQANSAGIFRSAGLMARGLGVKVCAVVHDAILIEAPAERIEIEAARATLCLERASRLFLGGLTLRVDVKVIREGDRFPASKGERVWNHVAATVAELAAARSEEARGRTIGEERGG